MPCSTPGLNVEATDLQSPHPCTRCVPILPPQYVLLLSVDRHAGTRRAHLEGWRLEKERKYAVCPFWTKLIRVCSAANDRAMMRTPEHARSKLRSKTYGVPRQNVPSNQSINQPRQAHQSRSRLRAPAAAILQARCHGCHAMMPRPRLSHAAQQTRHMETMGAGPHTTWATGITISCIDGNKGPTDCAPQIAMP